MAIPILASILATILADRVISYGIDKAYGDDPEAAALEAQGAAAYEKLGLKHMLAGDADFEGRVGKMQKGLARTATLVGQIPGGRMDRDIVPGFDPELLAEAQQRLNASKMEGPLGFLKDAARRRGYYNG